MVWPLPKDFPNLGGRSLLEGDYEVGFLTAQEYDHETHTEDTFLRTEAEEKGCRELPGPWGSRECES